MTPKTVRLPDGRLWLRVASPDWENSFDPSIAGATGGRWNALGLAASYPVDCHGRPIPRSACQPIGAELQTLALQGVWCRSACSDDGRRRELAWFARAQSATAAWSDPLPYGHWRYAKDWTDINVLENPPDPA